MPWFTPAFVSAPPPPPPTPPAIYRTYVPAPVAVPVIARPIAHPVATVPAALMKTVYLSKHRQKTIFSVLNVIAVQIGYRIDLNAHDRLVPAGSGIVWMSSPQQGASAISDLVSLGRSLGNSDTIVVNPIERTISLESNAR